MELYQNYTTVNRTKIAGQFLASLDEEHSSMYAEFMGAFEFSCLISDFEEAVDVFPFPVDNYRDDLERIHTNIRQLVKAKIGQVLMAQSCQGSLKATELLLQINSEEDSGINSFGSVLQRIVSNNG